jgi:mRNA interferase MazF
VAISFVPSPGHVLMCDFTGFLPPEMTKVRKVIVLSPRSRIYTPSTYLVVPTSMTPPSPAEACHCEFKPGSYDFFDRRESVWAKCDMVAHVAARRLDRVKINGRYTSPRIRSEDLARVRKCVLHAMGMERWIETREESLEVIVNTTLIR